MTLLLTVLNKVGIFKKNVTRSRALIGYCLAWIRVSKHGKFPYKSVQKFVLHIQSYHFTNKHVTAFACLNTVIQTLSMLLDFQTA